MKSFNLERALAGEPVVTRQGEKLAEIYFFKTAKEIYPISGVLNECIEAWTKEGKFIVDSDSHEHDLFMIGKEKSGWINIYDNGQVSEIYQTYEHAIDNKQDDYSLRKHVACIKVEWEE